MVVRVYLHANLRQKTPEGLIDRLELNLEPGARISTVLQALGLQDRADTLLLALNGRVAFPDQPLKDGDVLRLMPPIAGGTIATGG